LGVARRFASPTSITNLGTFLRPRFKSKHPINHNISDSKLNSICFTSGVSATTIFTSSWTTNNSTHYFKMILHSSECISHYSTSSFSPLSVCSSLPLPSRLLPRLLNATSASKFISLTSSAPILLKASADFACSQSRRPSTDRNQHVLSSNPRLVHRHDL
jgi:hypothetical protein